MFSLVSLSKSKVRVALVSHLCHSCSTRVALLSLVSHSCHTRVVHVARVMHLSCKIEQVTESDKSLLFS